jgi:aminopeptidase N
MRWLAASDSLQIDLFPELQLDSVSWRGRALPVQRHSHCLWVAVPPKWQVGDTLRLQVHYRGAPKVATNPPWDGGFVWKQDQKGRPWLTMACEGLGASVWWPCKDHLSDEPDMGMRIAVQLPPELTLVTNGWRKSVLNHRDGTRTHEWLVQHPINTYNVSLYVGHYVHTGEVYDGAKGPLKLDYYTLDYNSTKALPYLSAEVRPMLDCFERVLGPYPFYEDGYALVETPYWGMEHQGAIAYGNKFKRNEWGFDYIIVHESGHEWFGNHISVADHADMWIHEAFTTYTEAIYMECKHGNAKAVQYLLSQQSLIGNREAIQGPTNVNFDDWDDADMYYKGAWMLHTLRTILQDDDLWWAWFAALYKDLGGKQVDRQTVVAHASRHFNRDLAPFFAQYLDYAGLPVLEYEVSTTNGGTTVLSRWREVHPGFQMPVPFVPVATDSSAQVPDSVLWVLPGTEAYSATVVPGTGSGISWQPDVSACYLLPMQVTFAPAPTPTPAKKRRRSATAPSRKAKRE